jgi:Domain of unknown function (DUF4326)
VPVTVNAKGRKSNGTQPHEVYIGRQTRNGWRKSKWANPFKLSRHGDRNLVIAMYRRWLLQELSPNVGDGLRVQAAAVWACEDAGLAATSIPSVNLTP